MRLRFLNCSRWKIAPAVCHVVYYDVFVGLIYGKLAGTLYQRCHYLVEPVFPEVNATDFCSTRITHLERILLIVVRDVVEIRVYDNPFRPCLHSAYAPEVGKD